MLLLKHLPIHSFNENIAYVNKECTAYKVDDIKTMVRVEIHGGSVPISAFLNVVTSNRLVKPGELALNTEAFRAIGLPEGARVSIVMNEPPLSLSAVHKKIRGGVLTLNEYKSIVHDIQMRRYSNIDLTSFLTACYSFFTPTEAVCFVKALLAEKKLYWDEEDIVVDSYTLGNIPGNNTDLIVMAIVAAYGLPIPKSIVRDKGINCGFSNTLEFFTDVDKYISNMVKQDDSLATYCTKIKKEDGKLDFSKSAYILHNMTRAFVRWPTAYCFYKDMSVRVFKSEYRETSNNCSSDFGKIVDFDNEGIYIQALNGIYIIKELQREGKKRQTVKEFLCGNKLIKGEYFT